MKTTCFKMTLIAVSFACTAAAQAPEAIRDKALKDGHAFNTGTFQDILTNYLQVAAKNITTDENGLQLKLNWFELNSMADKYSNVNFLRTAWQRNGEFIGALGADKDFKVKSFQLGLNYNVLNRRDTAMAFYDKVFIKPFNEENKILLKAVARQRPTVVSLIEPKISDYIKGLYSTRNPVTAEKAKTDLTAILPGLFTGKPSDLQAMNYLLTLVTVDINNGRPFNDSVSVRIHVVTDHFANEIINGPINDYIHSLGKSPLKFNGYVTDAQASDLMKFIDAEVRGNAFLHDSLKVSTLKDLNEKVLTDYTDLVNYVSRQPLLTFGYLYTHGKGTLLSSHVAGFNFLYGTGGWKAKNSGQLKASLTDTLNSNDPTGAVRNFKRNIIAVQAGYNQVLITSGTKSMAELSGAAELDKATSGFVVDDRKTRFYFNASIRGRLPSTPWLKVDLKWDPKNGNVFGLFDFTYNLDK
ncbi:hypothetical protein ACFFGT_06220 [Mucilaginibacter angelicae]|uniref:Uncharacterized protein n=1 Tax=Mucilaginibacter angelicae TaxID=869718 RepID=A0ABV6L221_9SPHI